ncbi:MAG: hypothetical protein H0V27_02795 [Pyrinomonadaceae bacterium]|nr:hypothetical protein [Pyrinomonadaceae bacterium]
MKDTMRVVGLVLLGVFVLIVGLPLVLAAAGIVLQTVGLVFGMAGAIIKVGVMLAVVYLFVMAARTLLKR